MFWACRMARPVQPLSSLALNLSSVEGSPQLSALTDKKALQAKIEEIQQRCLGIDLSPASATRALRWLSGLPLQLQTLEENYADTKRKWAMRENDIKSLMPYYRAVLKLYKEHTVNPPL